MDQQIVRRELDRLAQENKELKENLMSNKHLSTNIGERLEQVYKEMQEDPDYWGVDAPEKLDEILRVKELEQRVRYLYAMVKRLAEALDVVGDVSPIQADAQRAVRSLEAGDVTDER